jgi:hypothetical protein
MARCSMSTSRFEPFSPCSEGENRIQESLDREKPFPLMLLSASTATS